MKLNLLESAFLFDYKKQSNPPETAFLHANALKWRTGHPEFDGVVWGALFEEARTLTTITVRLKKHFEEFSNRIALQYAMPGIEWNNSKCYTWYQSEYVDCPFYPEHPDDLTYIYRIPGLISCGLRMYVHPKNFPLCENDFPEFESIFADGPETVKKTLTVESGLWGAPKGVSIASVHNGSAVLCENSGKACLEIVMTEGISGPDRTVVMLDTARGKVSFLPAQCISYMAIPDFGLLIRDDEVPDSVYRDPRTGRTILERLPDMPWRTFGDTCRDIGLKPVNGVAGKTDTFTRYATATCFVTPDTRMNEHWNIGLSHLMSFCTDLGGGRWDVKIGPYPMFGTESAPIIRMLEIYGRPDVALGALNVFLDSASRTRPEGCFADSEGCLNIPYGIYKTDCWVPYEPAYILRALADHCYLSGDSSFVFTAKDKLIGCIKWIFRQIDAWKVEGCADAGLIPPARSGDISDWATFFEGDAVTYSAVKETLKVLEPTGDPRLPALLSRLNVYREDIRAAYRKGLSLVPVVLLRDGTYAPSFAVKTYMHGWMCDVWPFSPVNALRGAWQDVDHSLQIFEAGVFDAEEPETRWALNAFEDNLVLNSYLMPKKWDDIRQDPVTGARDATACQTDYDPERDWFAWGGTGWQNGYCPLMQVYLKTGNAKAYIRSFYNTYALHADPENYWLREHAASLRYSAKTFEEGWMLWRLRAILVWDTPDELYLCRCAPDSWYSSGFEVAGMPTFYGILDMKCSDGALDISLKKSSRPGSIHLRLPDREILLDPDQSSWSIRL